MTNTFVTNLYTYRGGDFSPNAFFSFMAEEIKNLHGIVLNKNASAVIANNFFKGKDKLNLLHQLIQNDEDWAIMYLFNPKKIATSNEKNIHLAKASLISAIKYFDDTKWPALDSHPINHMLTLAHALGYIGLEENNPLVSLQQQLSKEREQIHSFCKK